ncbi:hypothetical protein HYE67_008084 [Fusarium culmorum]|uniref:Ubiquitin-like domain-containing protein n=1 Tax=Fusarium culmorum TaxID=5516 RepID=A0A7S8DC57_FUSCU|nr:hypothetical protein HYE67_008084 [Fusarium culmorum]
MVRLIHLAQTALAFSIYSKSLYKVKIFVGGQNICSYPRGGHEDADEIQDYFVIPSPLTIHGIFVKKGLVRQLVALESERSGYSIEHQMTGQDRNLNIRMEFFPERRRLEGQFYFTIVTKKSVFAVYMNDVDATIQDIKDRIYDTVKIPQDQQRLIYSGKQLEDGRNWSEYSLQRASVVFLVLRLVGGGGTIHDLIEEHDTVDYTITLEPTMAIAPGGFISHEIIQDPTSGEWRDEPAYTVNLQVVNYKQFTSITGLSPKTPSPDEVAKITLEKCTTKELENLAGEETHLQGIGEMYAQTGIDITGPYNVNRAREDRAPVKLCITVFADIRDYRATCIDTKDNVIVMSHRSGSLSIPQFDLYFL